MRSRGRGFDGQSGRVSRLALLRWLGRDAVAHGQPRLTVVNGEYLTDTIRLSIWAFCLNDEMKECSSRWAVSANRRLEAASKQLGLHDVVDAHTVVSAKMASVIADTPSMS
jgi:hypothetical protein